MNNIETKTENKKNAQASSGSFVEPRVFLSKDKNYLTLVLPGNILVRKHVNYFKRILEVPFTSVLAASMADDSQVA